MNVSEIFGSNVFNETVMKEVLPSAVFAEVSAVLAGTGRLSMESANVVANAMKDWAVSKGATHYTHWFQPLTGTTAEKHDSFLTYPEAGKTVLKLTGKQLIMGEADGSSFPSGGLRATHYARGYTAWDMTSPAFVKEQGAGTILCIPTVFVSYTGEALDNKTPLLRSMQAINDQSLRILRLFGDEKSTKILPSVGAEQEYFLVDRAKYLKRRDLIYTGRTLFGAKAPKGQELDDQYYGVIRERVGHFMKDLNVELWKMGITASTQHNEVAPSQHEMAPIYADANLAVDQNQLTMETMKRVATQHDLVCLLHEKPYAGVNGSGKHNNWSINSDAGEQMLDPGKSPNTNLRFLLVLSCIMKAVDIHAGLLRQSTATPGNDHRLGAQEAPPAIISIFLGDQLDDVVAQIVQNGTAADVIKGGKMDTGVNTVPVFRKDATDRNRTSPFAFTGNKFEFRMVGSSDSIANCNTVLNTIVADAFCDAADALEKAVDFEHDVKTIIAQNMIDHAGIVFNGNGYSDEWVVEAQKRGMPNLKSMVEAIPTLTADSSVKVFERFGIFSKEELESRQEVMFENYAKTIKIEAETMVHMVGKHYVPAVISHMNTVATSMNNVKAACPNVPVSVQENLLKASGKLLGDATVAMESLQAQLAVVQGMEDVGEMAKAYHDVIVPTMAQVREPIDQLELMVDKDIWPVPTYGDLMFEI